MSIGYACHETWADEVGHDDVSNTHRCTSILGFHQKWNGGFLHTCMCGALEVEPVK